jgi:hemerythrin-like domain-containing protein
MQINGFVRRIRPASSSRRSMGAPSEWPVPTHRADVICGARGFFDPSYETTMPDTLAQWHAEHVNFARLLDIFAAELDALHEGTRPNYELMLDIMFYMTHYPDVVHHPREDLAFARIKALDARAGPAVDELSRQHAQLHKIGAELFRGLSDIVNGSIASRESVETQGRTYVANFRNHMSTEENDILPIAAKLLQPKDWSAIRTAVKHIDDPLFGKSAEKRFAALHEEIARNTQVAKEPAR